MNEDQYNEILAHGAIVSHLSKAAEIAESMEWDELTAELDKIIDGVLEKLETVEQEIGVK